jgi:ketosteroid isomerase-like protein
VVRENGRDLGVLRFEPEEVIDVDATRVIAVVRTKGRAKGTGIAIDQQLTHLWTILGGKATRLITFDTRQQALDAVAGTSAIRSNEFK